MLPHFIEGDFKRVLEEMADAGLPFERSWFDLYVEFWFFYIGKVVYDVV